MSLPQPFFLRVRFQPDLFVSRGKLTPGKVSGTAVHAASFLRKRLVVLDCSLLRAPRELRRIWWHELAHFVWWQLGNPVRKSWEALLQQERAARVSGELGWSAESRKQALKARDFRQRTRLWREYCCESFCDSLAWLLCAIRSHGEITLPAGWRTHRRRWLQEFLGYNRK